MTFRYLVFMLLCSSFSFSQITGKVVDKDSNEPIDYATVALIKSNNTIVTGVITNEDGEFLFEKLKADTYTLEVSFLGYEITRKQNILVTTNNQPVNVSTISLKLKSNQLNEVVVSAEKSKVISKIDRQVFDAKTYQSAEGGTGVDLVKNLPSISLNGEGNLSLRGSSGFVVLLNNKPFQGNATDLLNQLPANAIDRIEVITAPSAKYDPEGKGGILNIITKKGALEGAFAQVSIRGGFPSIEDYNNKAAAQRHGIDATYNLIKGKWGLSFGASYQRNDKTGRREGDVFTIINDTKTQFPSDGERSFDEVNYSGRFTADYAANTNNQFSLGLFAGKRKKDRLADINYFNNTKTTPANSNSVVSEFQYYNHNLRTRQSDFALGSLDYKHTFTNKSEFSTSFLYEYTLLGGPTENDNLGINDYSIVYQREFNTNENPLNGIRFQADYKLKPFSFGTLETGYQYRALDHKGGFEYTRQNQTTNVFELVPEFSSEVDLKRIINSGFVQLTGKKNSWEYAAGVRLEHVKRDFDLRDKTNTVDTTYTYNYTKLFPSASIQYTFDNKLKLKAAYSKRVERTTTFKMNPFPEREHSETLEQGDPELRPEFIDLFEIGLSKKLNSGNSIYATTYFRNVKNVVNRVNTIYNDTILNRIYTNVGTAKALGLEVGSQIKMTKNWTSVIGANIYNYNIDGAFNGDKIDSKSTIYSLNLNSTYSFWENASVQFNLNYLSERNTAQGEDSRFYSPNLTFQKSFLSNRLKASLQWQHIDMGLLNSNEQRITTFKPQYFYTTTNYVYEVDVVVLNLSYTFKNGKNKSKFIDSEFGKREF